MGSTPAGEDPLQVAFHVSGTAMAVLDAEGRFARVNLALTRLLDAPPEALIGRAFPGFSPPFDGPREQLLEGGRRIRIDGTGAAPVLVFVSDVTGERAAADERQQLQAQHVHSERLRTLGQIATGIAHEINNPAAVAVAGVDLARRRMAALRAVVEARQTAKVAPALESLEAALAYCEDGTLRVSQAARRLGVFSTLTGSEVEALDIAAVVGRALELVRNDLRHRARLVTDLAPVPRTWGSAARLTQAFTNLLLNAGQAIDGPSGDNVITITTRATETEVFVEVRDTGIGMSEDARARLFEPGGGPAGRPALGLTVVGDVVRQHRGQIEVQSVRGRGSLFRVRLPIDNGLAPVAAPAPIRRGRLLLIDDEPLLLELVREMLAEHWDVEVAPSGEEALTLLAKDSAFDAVICDLMMPGLDGMGVHNWLREHAPPLATRMVVATGGAFTDRAERWLQATGLPVIGKPFSAEVLLRACAQVVARAEGRA